jgi:hypothetical protein
MIGGPSPLNPLDQLAESKVQTKRGIGAQEFKNVLYLRLRQLHGMVSFYGVDERKSTSTMLMKYNTQLPIP